MKTKPPFRPRTLAPRPLGWMRTRTALRLSARAVQAICVLFFVAAVLTCAFGSSDDGLHCAGIFLALIFGAPLVLAAQVVAAFTARDEQRLR